MTTRFSTLFVITLFTLSACAQPEMIELDLTNNDDGESGPDTEDDFACMSGLFSLVFYIDNSEGAYQFEFLDGTKRQINCAPCWFEEEWTEGDPVVVRVTLNGVELTVDEVVVSLRVVPIVKTEKGSLTNTGVQLDPAGVDPPPWVEWTCPDDYPA